MKDRNEVRDAEYLREVLHHELNQRYEGEPDTVIIDELGICQGKARVDLAVVNGQLHGYEIKSERDSLRRLESQCEPYSMVFDRVTLVCGERHLAEALVNIPSWWEVLSITPSGPNLSLQCVQTGADNPNINARALVELLWSQQALSLVAQRHSLKGLRGKPRAVIWDKICELFTIEEVATAVRIHLKATAKNRGRHEQRS